ncbi:MAG: amidohydrolase family protein, partial [Nitrospinales bacterium]
MNPSQTAIKIRFGHLLPMRGEEVEDGELIVERGKVKSIGPRSPETFDGLTIDLSDCLVLPGFVNAHCHLALSALRGRVPKTDKFADWVLSLIEQDQAVSREERIRCLRQGAEDLIRSGVVTLADYLAMPELLEEYAALPFRQIVFLEALGFKGSVAETTVERLEAVLKTAAPQNKLLKLGLAPHAPYSTSPALYRGLRDLADKYGCPFSSHVAEIPEEIKFLQDGGGALYDLLQNRRVYDDAWRPPGKSPLQYLDDLGVLDSLAAVHLNHIENDIPLMADKLAAGIFCPGSSRWFGRKRWMPVRGLLDGGVPVGIGTDSLASNDSLNFFEELRTAEEMLPNCGRREILEMATWRGAEAL